MKVDFYCKSLLQWDYMNGTLKVKNGVITLPRELRDDWKDGEARIREYSADRIIIERLTHEKKEQIIEAWKKAQGILKGKIPDPVAWQRHIRREWERKLPKLRVHR